MARPLAKPVQNAAETFAATEFHPPIRGALPHAGGDGPARRLQQELAQELERALAGAGDPRWSARRSLGFVVLTNGAFWIALIWGLRAALS